MNRRLWRDLQTGRFWAKFGLQTFAAMGFEATLLGLYNIVEPGAISRLELPTLVIVPSLAILYGGVRSWPRPIEETYATPNTQIRLLPGDLFARDDHLVIGMSTTFDTAVPHIIRPDSIQGQFLARIYDYDQPALDRELTQALANMPPSGSIQKDGKQTTYPLGTVAVIRHNRRHYFCVAYSEMNEFYETQGTADGLWRSLINLWAAVRRHANGEPVAIPLIGGGESRLSQILPAQDSIRFIALSFMLASRQTKVCDRLDIIVKPADLESIDMLEFQAFLTSLKRS